jgi:hypothetical protein
MLELAEELQLGLGRVPDAPAQLGIQPRLTSAGSMLRRPLVPGRAVTLDVLEIGGGKLGGKRRVLVGLIRERTENMLFQPCHVHETVPLRGSSCKGSRAFSNEPGGQVAVQGLAGSVDGDSVKTLEGTGARPDVRALSPELALVDFDLAAEARESLPKADDTLARVELLVRANRIAAERARVAASPSATPDRPVRPLPANRSRGNRRRAALAGGAVAVAVVGALLVGVRVSVRGTPAGADTAAIGQPPVPVGALPRTQEEKSRTPHPQAATTTEASPRTGASARTSHPKATTTPRPRPHVGKPAARAKRRTRSRAAKAAPARRFVWAPVAGASGYRVEFFRGSRLVFSAETSSPTISVPSSWTLRGRHESLRPGSYQWYVWPLHGSLRAPSAVVRATLVVPRG